MRAVLLITMVLTMGALRGLAQQQALDSSSGGTNSGALTQTLRFSSLTAGDMSKATSNIFLGKKLTVSGPVVQTFKVKRAADAPRRALQLINPFAPVEHIEQVERSSGLSTRAWSTTVGLHPGGSAFPDATTHESTMSLIAIGR